MKNTVIKFGLYSLTAAAVLFFLALYLGQNLDYDTQEVLGYATIVVSLSFVYFGIKHYRDKVNNGAISFGKALLIGVLISAFAGIGFGIVDYIYTSTINPDFNAEYIAHSLKEMESTLSASEFIEQKQKLEEQMEAYGSSGFMAFMMFSLVLIIGFVISLIASLILQRKNKNYAV